MKPGQRIGLGGNAPQRPHDGALQTERGRVTPLLGCKAAAAEAQPCSEVGPGHWALNIQATHSEAVLGSGFWEHQCTLSFPESVSIKCVITGAEHEPETANAICAGR